MKLSQNFELWEFEKSMTAEAANIDNKIPEEYIPNIQALVDNVLQPLRESCNRVVNISSGYRSPALNRLIGGAKDSQHLTGQAVDITVAGFSCYHIATFIKNHLPFDQLIWENYNLSEMSQWVHVSFVGEKNRFDIKKSKYSTGSRIYEAGL